VFPLSAAFIEKAHDIGINFTWPGIEPVQRGTCLDVNLLKSAEAQPYQECFGCELYPTLAAKAAYLFYHLATGHIFSNGNKRTAALCLDLFLTANSYYMILSNDDVHDLAQSVASSGERSEKYSEILERVTDQIAENIMPFSAFRVTTPQFYRALHKNKKSIRNARYNKLGYPLSQVTREASN
jgi:death-on-curing family protein